MAHAAGLAAPGPSPLTPTSEQIGLCYVCYGAYNVEASHLLGYNQHPTARADWRFEPPSLTPGHAETWQTTPALLHYLDQSLAFDAKNKRWTKVSDPPRPGSREELFNICRKCVAILFAFLRWRVTHPSLRVPYPLCSTHDLFVRLCAQRAGIEAGTSIQDAEGAYVWRAKWPDPPIPSLPKYILSKLHRVPAGTISPTTVFHSGSLAPGFSHRSSLSGLPQELLQAIARRLDVDDLHRLRLSGASMGRRLPLDQWYYFHELLAGNLLGFLTGLNRVPLASNPRRSADVLYEIRDRALRRRMVPPAWDWRRLVGDLARASSFEDGGPWADAPPSLRSRRWRWHLYERLENEMEMETEMEMEHDAPREHDRTQEKTPEYPSIPLDAG